MVNPANSCLEQSEKPKHSTKPPTSSLREEKHVFETFDGTKLFYRAWLPDEKIVRLIILLHRGHEHSGRLKDLAIALTTPNTAYFAFDARGHGNSPGPSGDAPTFSALPRDIDCFVKYICKQQGIHIEDVAVVANSVAGVVASAWVHDYAPPIKCLVLVAPAFRIKLYIPGAITGLRIIHNFASRPNITSYVKGSWLTHDPEQIKAYDSDSLIAKTISVSVLLGLHDTATRILRDAAAITTPILMLQAGSDRVVKNYAQDLFFDNLGSTIKEKQCFNKFYHGLLHEKERREPIALIKSFIERAFQQKSVTNELVPNGQSMYENLQTNASWFSPKGFYYNIYSIGMKTTGRLSKGIRLGWQTGFDSGKTLDYVYENVPRGFTLVGRLLDRAYLESPGWVGIRKRKKNLQELIGFALNKLQDNSEQVTLLDLAAGGGRYVLETLCETNVNVRATLRDLNEGSLEKAMELARELHLEHVVVEKGDAFSLEEIADISPRPNIVIVSGLYELFPDNALVTKSLQEVGNAVRVGGYLIYTNQLWHPQQEFIARVLKNRNGDQWIMRCRSQMEMDELVRSAGFEKIETRMDDLGIFSVSLAVRK